MDITAIHTFANTGKLPPRLLKKVNNLICANCGKRHDVHILSTKYPSGRCPDSKLTTSFKRIR